MQRNTKNEAFNSLLSPAINHLSSRIKSSINHPSIKAIRCAGLLMAVEFDDADTCIKVCHACIANGIITDWFLFAPNCMRVAPPLIVEEEELIFFELNLSKSLSQVFGLV
jgi:acetylornithine/succinyldiaminopimelate/putrescine aminotransferase